MRMNAFRFALLLSPLQVCAQQLAILDMHLHARGAPYLAANSFPMCAPFERMPYWDPKDPEGGMAAFGNSMPCKGEPIWHGKSEAEVMQQTIAVMQRRNIHGTVSGETRILAPLHAAEPAPTNAGIEP